MIQRLTSFFSSPSAELTTDELLFANAGANLFTDTPEIANWLANLMPDKDFTIGG